METPTKTSPSPAFEQHLHFIPLLPELDARIPEVLSAAAAELLQVDPDSTRRATFWSLHNRTLTAFLLGKTVEGKQLAYGLIALSFSRDNFTGERQAMVNLFYLYRNLSPEDFKEAHEALKGLAQKAGIHKIIANLTSPLFSEQLQALGWRNEGSLLSLEA